MKLYNSKQHRLLYSLNPDIYFDIEDEHKQLLDVLASEKLDGHDRYTQWMMAMEIKYRELLDTMRSLDKEGNDKFIEDIVCESSILEY